MTSTASLGASSVLSASHAGAFFTAFRTRLAALAARIDALNADSADTDADTDNLVHELADARRTLLDETAQIPPRDREGHERALRDLADRLAAWTRTRAGASASASASEARADSTATTPAPSSRPRFAFKRTTPATSAVGSRRIPAAPVDAVPEAKKRAETSEQGAIPSTAEFEPAPPKPQDSPVAPPSVDLRLQHRSKAILDLGRDATDEQSALLTIQVRSLQDCIVLVPPLQGSVMVHDCANCLIVVEECRQYRMHNTTACTIILAKSATGATIENCDKILFGAALAEQARKRFRVQDFDHISSSIESPYWQWLPPQHPALVSAQQALEQLRAPSLDLGSDVAESLRSQVLQGLHSLITDAFDAPT